LLLLERLATIAQLAKSGDHEGRRLAALEVAHEYPGDVHAQLAAAYACDRLGREDEAINHYRIASTLDIPEGEKANFYLGFASTLRNVGSADEAIAYLCEACRQFPDRPEYMAFLALSYHTAGQHSLALATMLKAGLMAARKDGFGVYDRALGEYHDELIASTRSSTDPSDGE
jgi:tetratricopeptide (TPR) repeat protein